MNPALVRRPRSLLIGILAMAAVASRNRNARPQNALPMWLTLPAACQHTGLSEGLLLRLVEQRKVLAIQDGETKLRRADLDRVAKLRDLVNLGAELRRMKARRR